MLGLLQMAAEVFDGGVTAVYPETHGRALAPCAVYRVCCERDPCTPGNLYAIAQSLPDDRTRRHLVVRVCACIQGAGAPLVAEGHRRTRWAAPCTPCAQVASRRVPGGGETEETRVGSLECHAPRAAPPLATVMDAWHAVASTRIRRCGRRHRHQRIARRQCWQHEWGTLV